MLIMYYQAFISVNTIITIIICYQIKIFSPDNAGSITKWTRANRKNAESFTK